MPGPAFASYSSGIRVQRRPKNPLDKCTIVSVYPNPIIDYKPTAFPQTHRIEGAADNDYSILVVESASWFKEQYDGGMESALEIPIPSSEVARAFIQDYVNALPEFVPDVAAPGLFYILGAHNKDSIKKYTDETGITFQNLLDAARKRQKEWFARIVRMADTDWARSNGNPRSIGETQKLAASKLQLVDKPWLADFNTIEKTSCPACGQLVNPAFPICPNCKAVVNEERAKALNLKFAS